MREKLKKEKIMAIGPGGFVALVFTVLKLCGVIHWSWLWVLVPFWGPLLIAITCFAVAAFLEKK